jgi:hypothetical protein
VLKRRTHHDGDTLSDALAIKRGIAITGLNMNSSDRPHFLSLNLAVPRSFSYTSDNQHHLRMDAMGLLGAFSSLHTKSNSTRHFSIRGNAANQA